MISKNPVVRWSAYVGVAIVFAIVCGFLANWQFNRSDERSGEIELVEQNYDAKPVEFSSVISGTDDFVATDEWLPVVLEGSYLTDQQLLARNRPRGGTSAFEVLVPFQLTDGRIVIVNRGWVPPGEGTLPDVIPTAPEGDVTVIARLRPTEGVPRSGGGILDGDVPTIKTINVPTIAEVTGPNTVTPIYALMVSEDPAASSVPNTIDPPTADPGPHLSYAIQWILFALMGFIFILYIIKTERSQRREDAGEVPARAKKKRIDADAAQEDALLDTDA